MAVSADGQPSDHDVLHAVFVQMLQQGERIKRLGRG